MGYPPGLMQPLVGLIQPLMAPALCLCIVGLMQPSPSPCIHRMDDALVAVPFSVIGLIHAIRLPIGLMGPMLPNGLIQPCLIGTNHSIQQCLMGTNRSIGLMQP